MDNEISHQLQEKLGAKNFKQVTEPSIQTDDGDEKRIKYFQEALAPTEDRLKNIFKDSALPKIEEKLVAIEAPEEDLQAFRDCLDIYVDKRAKLPSAPLSAAIDYYMQGYVNRAEQEDEKFLGILTWLEPELEDPTKILVAFKEVVSKAVIPAPNWDEQAFAEPHQKYLTEEERKPYEKALNVLNKILPKE